MKHFFGKYRGTVSSNIDPLMQGRLQVSVPAVLGTDGLSWAMPCVPYAGPGVGFLFLPPNGANVWVEFEGGDPDYAVWTGCFWGLGEAPMPAIPGQMMLKTQAFTLTINEVVPAAPLVSIEVSNGAKLAFTPAGAELSVSIGTLALSGLQITLNNDALVVLPLMPAPVLTAAATVACPHMAPAIIAATGARVLVAGQPAALLSDLTTVAGCPLAAALPPSPCVTVKWLMGSTRVLVGNQPVLLLTAAGLAQNPAQAPQGPPLMLAAQPRVMAT